MIVRFRNRRYNRSSLQMRLAVFRAVSTVLAVLGVLITPAAAQDGPRSECLAMSSAPPPVMPASLRQAAAATGEVAITYVGHSTYFIDTPGGVQHLSLVAHAMAHRNRL